VQVILEGFKSYKEQTETEPFSPKVNTIGVFVWSSKASPCLPPG
jgi:hypothetical protein